MPTVHMLTSFVAARFAKEPTKTTLGTSKSTPDLSTDEVLGDDVSTCADLSSPALSFTSDGESVSTLSGDDQDDALRMTIEEHERDEPLDLARSLALQLVAELEPLAEDRTRASIDWVGYPVGVRTPLGAAYPSLFQPLRAAENGRLLANVVDAARAPGCAGLAKAIADARQGLSTSGSCLPTLERVCQSVHKSAFSELKDAKVRRTEFLEDGRMRQDRGRAPLGCSRPPDVGLGVAALRLSCCGQVAADEQTQALEDHREQVLALHAAVGALAGLLQAVADP